MYVQNYKTKSKLSEYKSRKKLKCKGLKSTKTTTDTKFCKKFSIQQAKLLQSFSQGIDILYQNLNEYYELKLFGILTKQDKITNVKFN